MKKYLFGKTVAALSGMTMAFTMTAGTFPFAYAGTDTMPVSSELQDTDKKDNIKPLKDVCEGFFRTGTRASVIDIQNYGDFIKTHYNSITPANELVPENIIDQKKCKQDGNNVETIVSFNESTDKVLSFCEENEIPIRGNCFVWYSQTPLWFFKENFDMSADYVSPEVMNQRLESFIKNTFAEIKEKYPKLKIEAYDVCKELFVNDGGGYRPKDNNYWMAVYGGDNSFVYNAYKYAREYAPEDCKLFYSDYNEYMPDKRDDIYNLASGLCYDGLLDGIGMQGYFICSDSMIMDVAKAYYDFKSLGVDVQFTELNLSCNNNEDTAAEQYAEIFRLCMKNKETTNLITFDIPSDASDNVWRWRRSDIRRLFNSNLSPGKAYYKLCELAEEMRKREAQKEQIGQNTGLKDVFEDFFKAGAVINHINEPDTSADFLKKNYNLLTPSALTPDMILDMESTISSGSDTDIKVNLSNADKILKFCEDNGISIRGNCFVWYSQTPSWFFRENFSSSEKLVSPEVMNKRLESFIKNTFAELKEKYPKLVVSSYDVCNEVFENDTGSIRAAKNNTWMEIYGDESYIENAFRYARQYAPEECKLFLSDYNEYYPEKCDAIAELAASLKELGVLDGVGMQSWLSYAGVTPDMWKDAFYKFTDLGLDIELTNLEMYKISYGESEMLFTEIMKICLENKDHISSVTMSGASDKALTYGHWGEKKDNVLFDYYEQPKQAFYELYYLADELRSKDENVQNTEITDDTENTDNTENADNAENVLCGDANSDGIVNAADLSVFVNYLLSEDADYSEAALDMNGDEKVTIVDLIMLKNKLLEN